SCRASGIGDVTFQVRAGEIVGFAGLVGAGRTELARVLFGLTPSDGGVIGLRGSAARIATPADAVKLGLAYLPEDRRRHGAIAEIRNLIVERAAQGLAILLSSSDLSEILGLSDRVVVMRSGTVAGTLDRSAATQQSILTLALGHAPAQPAPDPSARRLNGGA